jgi:hypothetical protein
MKAWLDSVTYAKDDMVTFGSSLYVSLAKLNLGNEPTEEDSEWWVLYMDPITQVYNALWTLLESHAPLTQLVELRNRIKFSGTNTDPVKAEVLTADLPELRLVPLSGSSYLTRTSSSSTILQQFRVELSTGDQRVDAALFPIQWEVYRALCNWVTTLQALKWNSKAYVTTLKAGEHQQGVTNTDLQRGIKGWSLLWSCSVEMTFTTTDLTT